METINPAMLDKLADALSSQGYFTSKRDFDLLVKQISGKACSPAGRSDDGSFSICRALRGLSAMQAKVISEVSREMDIQYAQKTLLTGTTPGSFLVPTAQADSIVQLLASSHVIRAAGARIWPMASLQKLNVPVESSSPT